MEKSPKSIQRYMSQPTMPPFDVFGWWPKCWWSPHNWSNHMTICSRPPSIVYLVSRSPKRRHEGKKMWHWNCRTWLKYWQKANYEMIGEHVTMKARITIGKFQLVVHILMVYRSHWKHKCYHDKRASLSWTLHTYLSCNLSLQYQSPSKSWLSRCHVS